MTSPSTEILDLASLTLDAPQGVGSGQAMTPTDLAELLGVFNDVTARLEETHRTLRSEVTRLNTELRHANEALERSRRLVAIGEMAAGIAHEVRNPVGSIQLYAKMLEDDLVGLPESRATATKIANAARGLNAIVGDVLAFAREIRARPSPVEVGGLISGVLDACADVIERLGPALRVTFCGGERDEIACDAELIHRAMVNIVRNACEAMLECKAVASEGGLHELSFSWGVERDRDGCVWDVLGVGDTGPGLSDDVIERMFNPFFTTRAAGPGLGLSIVHRIVEAHGGEVRVCRTDPRGTKVEVRLPHAAAVRGSHGPVESCMECPG